MKKWARAGGFAALLILFAIGALELFCRRGWVPNRAAAHARTARQAASPHVLVLGDSFAFEYPDEPDSYGRKLAAWLAGQGASVVNLSNGGLGPFEYLESFEGLMQLVPEYRPRLVIVNYYAGNDVTDTLFRLRGRASRVYPPDGLFSRSYLARFLADVFERRHIRSRRAQIRSDMRASGLPEDQWNAVLFDVCHRHPAFFDDNLVLPPEEAWREIERLLGAIIERAKGIGARVLVNVFPSTLQVGSSHAAQFRALGCRVDDRAFESEEPQRRLRAFCERSGVVCNDLLPAFRAERDHERYQPNDEHWNAEGHALAFARVTSAIGGAGLLK
jgi:hypothetical protein